MEKFKVEEGAVQETLMMPLYGRVYCEEHFPNTFPNKEAKETASEIRFSLPDTTTTDETQTATSQRFMNIQATTSVLREKSS